MAIRIDQKPNVNLVDANYPLGTFIDAGSSPGTPLTVLTHNDLNQTYQRSLERSGRDLGNGLPDNGTNGYEIYESLNFWQEAGSATPVAGDLLFYTDDSLMDPAAVTQVIYYNKFCLLGNTMKYIVQAQVKAVGAGIQELYMPFPSAIVSALGTAFIDNNNGTQLSFVDNANQRRVLTVRADITTNCLIIAIIIPADFSSVKFILDLNLTIPLISGLV